MGTEKTPAEMLQEIESLNAQIKQLEIALKEEEQRSGRLYQSLRGAKDYAHQLNKTLMGARMRTLATIESDEKIADKATTISNDYAYFASEIRAF